MRGAPDPQLAMPTTLGTGDLIATDHPIHRIRVIVDSVLAELDSPVAARHFRAPGLGRYGRDIAALHLGRDAALPRKLQPGYGADVMRASSSSIMPDRGGYVVAVS